MDKAEIMGDTIRVPSDQNYLSVVDNFLEEKLRGWGVEDSVLADIAISVSELVNNAMLHGNKSAPDKRVTVTVGREDGMARVRVEDEGRGFNPREIDDPLAEENLLKEVGRGIFIVRNLMDKVDIEATKHGTAVTISKAI